MDGMKDLSISWGVNNANESDINSNESTKLKPIGEEQVLEANTILMKYKEGKANLDQRVRDNDEWWRLRHYARVKEASGKWVDPTKDNSSGWLFESVLCKHADAMDSFPEFNCLPREQGDEAEAKKISSILPCVLEGNDFEGTYSNCWFDKLKNGTGVYGVFWDGNKLNGLGDIAIEPVNILNLYWEPQISNIQDSTNVFYVQLKNKDDVINEFPFADANKINGRTIYPVEYQHDDMVDNSEKVEVVSWYYHKNGVLHYCKYCNGEVLFSTENDAQAYPNGLYEHGKYPFVFDVMYPIKDSPAGFGQIDIGKQAQLQIDRMNNAIVENCVISSKPRFFKSKSSSINNEDLTDLEKQIIEVDGSVSEEYLRQIKCDRLDSIYVSVLNNKVEELKETTGNRDVNNGGAQSGATAASAIAAMQEAAGKLSRDMIKASYRAYREIITICIELIRQFYDLPRQFRIVGETGYQYVLYSSNGIKDQPVEDIAGNIVGYSSPVFDIIVSAQKSSPYNKMSQNELALQFYNAGFFNPQFADMASACLEMMDFKDKDKILQRVQQNGTMYQMLQQMTNRVAQLENMLGIQGGINGAAMGGQAQGQADVREATEEKNADGNIVDDEHHTVKKARERAAAVAEPR